VSTVCVVTIIRMNQALCNNPDFLALTLQNLVTPAGIKIFFLLPPTEGKNVFQDWQGIYFPF
jgi:hypothetical protein